MEDRSLDTKARRPAACCRHCGFAWHSAAMAAGLRLLGSCPRCAGPLRFRGDAQREAAEPVTGARAPHLVLGLPRGRTQR